MSKGTRGALMRGAVWIGVARILTNLIGLASTVILARLLSPDDFGLVAIASAFAIITATITELSLSEALIQHDEPSEDHYHTAFSLNLTRGFLLAAVVALLAWPAAVFYGDPRLSGIILGLAGGVFVGGLVNPKLVIFERRLEFHQWIFLGVAEKLSGFIVAIALAIAFQSYWALVLGQIVSQCARAATSYVLISYRPRLTFRHYRDLLSFSIWLTLGQAVQAINWRSDPLILGYFLPTAQLGQFSVGGRVTNIAISEVLQPISKVLFPAFARLKHDADRLRQAYLRSQGLLFLAACPIALGLAVLAEPLVMLLIGKQWLDAVPVIQILAIAGLAQRFVNVGSLVMATGHTKALFGRDVRALIIRMPCILTGLLLAPSAGLSSLVGATIGITLSSLLNALWNMQLIANVTQISMADQVSILWRPLIAGAVMGALVMIADAHWNFGAGFAAMAASLAVSVALGAAVYLLTIFLLWRFTGRADSPEREAAYLAAALLSRMRGARA